MEMEDELYYDTGHPVIGKCLIISNDTFILPSGRQLIKPRIGAVHDIQKLIMLFAVDLGFGSNTEIHTNLDSTCMKRVLQDASKADYSSMDCFVCFILTHGSEGNVVAADCEDVKIRTILSYFHDDVCHESLIGKPKLFFIQACRGRKKDSGVLMQMRGDGGGGPIQVRGIRHRWFRFLNFVSRLSCLRTSDSPDSPEYEDSLAELMKDQPDVLVAYSTVEHYVAFLNDKDGSWFIQELCNVFRMNHSDVLSMLTSVHCFVAYKHESDCSEKADCKKKQTPCLYSTFRKKFYFVKK